MRIHHIILLWPYNCNIRFDQARNYRLPLCCVIHAMNISLSVIYENLIIIFQIQSQKPWSQIFRQYTRYDIPCFNVYIQWRSKRSCALFTVVYTPLCIAGIYISWIMIDSDRLNIVQEKSQKRSSVHDCQDTVIHSCPREKLTYRLKNGIVSGCRCQFDPLAVAMFAAWKRVESCLTREVPAAETSRVCHQTCHNTTTTGGTRHK